MTRYFARALFFVALVAGIALPGEAAYTGAYIALAAGALGLVLFAWPERTGLVHPVSLAILAAIALVCATLPFVYQGPDDLMAPVFILPMLTTIGMGLLARPIDWRAGALILASICLLAVCIAFFAGLYQDLFTRVRRVGLGTNPIHYASLAAMVGGLSLIGFVSTETRWRYLFLLGPLLGIGATIISGSRGPLAGAVGLAIIGMAFLFFWHRADRLLRIIGIASVLIGAAIVAIMLATGSGRVFRLVTTALDIFTFTGGRDDIRAALYSSALHSLIQSPLFGMGFGQIMQAAQQLYPEHRQVFGLDNLHADWANFATMAGGMGLIAWLLLLAAPLLLLTHKAVRRDRPIVLGAVLLVTGQALLGVSNAMFGVLPQTMVYAVALGYLLTRARQIALDSAETAR